MQSFMHTVGRILLVFLCSSISAAGTPQPIARNASITHRVHKFYQRHPYMTYAAGGILCIGGCLVGYAIYPTSVQKIIFKKVSSDSPQVEHKTTCQKKKLDALDNTSIYNCLREMDPTISEESQRPIYKIYPVINSTNEKTDIAQIDTKGIFCKSNQSVRAFLAENKLLTTQKNITLYFKEDDSMAKQHYPLKIYFKKKNPKTYTFKGSDNFLDSLKQKNKSFYPDQSMQNPVFFYGLIAAKDTSIPRIRYGMRKPRDVYLQESASASVAQLVINTHNGPMQESDVSWGSDKQLFLTISPFLRMRVTFFVREDTAVSKKNGSYALKSILENSVNLFNPTALYLQEAFVNNAVGWEVESVTPALFEKRINNKNKPLGLVKQVPLPLEKNLTVEDMFQKISYKTPLEQIDNLVFYVDKRKKIPE